MTSSNELTDARGVSGIVGRLKIGIAPSERSPNETFLQSGRSSQYVFEA